MMVRNCAVNSYDGAWNTKTFPSYSAANQFQHHHRHSNWKHFTSMRNKNYFVQKASAVPGSTRDRDSWSNQNQANYNQNSNKNSDSSKSSKNGTISTSSNSNSSHKMNKKQETENYDTFSKNEQNMKIINNEQSGNMNDHDHDDDNNLHLTNSTNHGRRIQQMESFSARYIDDNGLYITTDELGRLTARPRIRPKQSQIHNSNYGNKDNSDNDHNDNLDKNIKYTEINKHAQDNQHQNNNDFIHSQQDNNEKDISTSTIQDSISTEAKPKSTAKNITAHSKLSKTSSKSITNDETNYSNHRRSTIALKEEVPKPISSGFNVVLTHCTADFDSLASAVGLAKLWSTQHHKEQHQQTQNDSHCNESDRNDNQLSNGFKSSQNLPTFVVLPRGAHPAVQKFLSLHKHLFPIRSLRSLPTDLSGLNRLGLVDAQRRDRIGPAEHLLSYANRITIVDHHIDGESDIPEANDYVVEKVGSVSAMIAERLRDANVDLTEAEATLLALGIHADTGSLCYDSTTPRDASALAYVMQCGASQTAIAEHSRASLSQEQQGVLTQALINTNSTVIHGVTVSTVLLSAEGFINGLAAVTQDALELSSSDVFILAVVYDAKAGRGKRSRRGSNDKKKTKKTQDLRLHSKLGSAVTLEYKQQMQQQLASTQHVMEAEAWKGGVEAMKRRRLRTAFDKRDTDGSGYLERNEIAAALATSGIIASEDSITSLMESIDTDGDGRVDFEEFIAFSEQAETRRIEQQYITGKSATTMIIIGRVKTGVNMKDVNLNKLFQQFGGGGHAKAASCTVRLDDESEAEHILQGLVDEIIEKSLMKQPTVGDFMTSPVLSAKPTMTEKQVEDLFLRYDVRALPVVDDNNEVVGLVTYKEVAAAKQRLWNKEQKRLQREQKERGKMGEEKNGDVNKRGNSNANKHRKQERKLGSALKGWMKQHVRTVNASMTMAEVENVLLENDVGCIPVVADGTNQLVGMVTRTDLLRQHRYYPSLHYHNKGFSDSIAARKPIIELRKKLKKFDPDV
eukprot:CAMPEP_0184862508 /NCGR_PEP_ID=MMETSP0580-20130426/6965_1 /TAXON_ID=1118495 /ORGANISM="Dactyliosolen fragilissimus" /LENGTH=1020 /DNA_ID=CAMNT_0027360411 /DNA_START=841 /DNA_END=3903 /DNA_ORIENTATION=+